MSYEASINYSLEYWEFDFLAKHLLNNEDVTYFNQDEEDAEMVARTERKGSTVLFHARRDNQNTWFNVFSLNDGENLGPEYLEEMTEKRIEYIAEESRSTYNLN